MSNNIKPSYRQPYDHRIQHLHGDYYQLRWVQPRKVKGSWEEANMRRVTNFAGAKKFSNKYNVELTQ